MKYATYFSTDKIKKVVKNKMDFYEFSIMAIIFLLILILLKISI